MKMEDAMIAENKDALRRLRRRNRALLRQEAKLADAMRSISSKTIECECRMDKCQTDIEEKKSELAALEARLAVLDDEKSRLREQTRAKRTALNRVKATAHWLELARICVEFLVTSEHASPAKVMVLAADLLKRSLRPGQHLAKLYGRWPDAVDVEAQIDWPMKAKEWAMRCWSRLADVAPFEEVEYARGRFQRFASRWMDGKDPTRRKKTIMLVGKEWEHFCRASAAAETVLRKRAESPDAIRLIDEMKRLNATGAAMRNALDRMGNRLAATATKTDLRAATRTILRGEDVSAPKPGPQMNGSKRRQISDAEKYLKTHAGCSLHNACKKSFSHIAGGYKSAGALYAHMHGKMKGTEEC